MEGNQDIEAYRQRYRKDNGELPGRSESEHIGGPECQVLKAEPTKEG
ncbi:hypothetical protein [Wolbachia endosymbiont (group A) of Barypeithes pellucidus]